MISLRFSNISARNPVGKLVRLPLALIPKQMVLPILQGPAKGLKWIVGSGVHGLWLGSYEADKQELLTTLPLAGKTVLDIGANVGFFSLLCSRLVGPSGRVIAFEPFPRNVDFIHRHITLNSVSNIEVRSVGIADKQGTANFSTSQYHEQGSLSDDGDLEVTVTTLDALEPQRPEVGLLKIDVEGAESAVLEGGKRFFEVNRPVILLATHGKAQATACREILERYNYSMKLLGEDLYGLDCNEWLATPKESSR